MKEQIKEIIDYVNENAYDGVKVEDIAEVFGYSKFHFSREFKKVTGVTLNEYISGVRIDKGISTILHGETVTQSQLDAGYSSTGTFSTIFKKNTGLSPREYSKSINNLYNIVKKQETVDEDSDHLFYRNPDYPAVITPYKLTVYIDVPEDFSGIIFSGLFLKPYPNHQPAMGRCRVKIFEYEFYHLPEGTYYPLACGIKNSLNPFRYFQLNNALRACDGQHITFPLTKNEVIRIRLREKQVADPPVIINLPNILANGIKQQIQRNKNKIKNRKTAM